MEDMGHAAHPYQVRGILHCLLDIAASVGDHEHWFGSRAHQVPCCKLLIQKSPDYTGCRGALKHTDVQYAFLGA